MYPSIPQEPYAFPKSRVGVPRARNASTDEDLDAVDQPFEDVWTVVVPDGYRSNLE
jgi:hypothetical protein